MTNEQIAEAVRRAKAWKPNRDGVTGEVIAQDVLDLVLELDHTRALLSRYEWYGPARYEGGGFDCDFCRAEADHDRTMWHADNCLAVMTRNALGLPAPWHCSSQRIKHEIRGGAVSCIDADGTRKWFGSAK